MCACMYVCMYVCMKSEEVCLRAQHEDLWETGGVDLVVLKF